MGRLKTEGDGQWPTIIYTDFYDPNPETHWGVEIDAFDGSSGSNGFSHANGEDGEDGGAGNPGHNAFLTTESQSVVKRSVELVGRGGDGGDGGSGGNSSGGGNGGNGGPGGQGGFAVMRFENGSYAGPSSVIWSVSTVGGHGGDGGDAGQGAAPGVAGAGGHGGHAVSSIRNASITLAENATLTIKASAVGGDGGLRGTPEGSGSSSPASGHGGYASVDLSASVNGSASADVISFQLLARGGAGGAAFPGGGGGASEVHLHEVTVNTGNGSDVVAITFEGGAGIGSASDQGLFSRMITGTQFDLGDGNDTLLIDASARTGSIPGSFSLATSQLRGGSGYDVLTLRFDSSENVLLQVDQIWEFEEIQVFGVTKSIFNLVGNVFYNLTGEADVFTGGGGDDLVLALGGDDTIIGGAGSDTIRGGAGNDTASYARPRSDYRIEALGDGRYRITDIGGTTEDQGSDTLEGVEFASFSDGTLALSSLLGVTINGTAGNDRIGPTVTVAGQPKPTAFSDTLYGMGGNDLLDGGAGADRMYGGSGNDTYFADDAADEAIEVEPNGADSAGTDLVNASVSYTLGLNVENLTLVGTAAIDGTGNGSGNKILGNASANTLRGLGGNDILDGKAGADAMYGGAGNDTYTVDDPGDSASEQTVPEIDDGGIDLVNSSVTFTLGAYIEKLTLIGLAAIGGTGNGLVNTITGNNAANLLSGEAGDDTLTGNGGNDELRGGSGNDRLNGGLGADAMHGGSGNDSYTVDDVGDTVSETENGADASGVDAVTSTVSFALAEFVENLTLSGTGNLDGTGNGLANRITGNSGANKLVGNGGNDSLTGNAGRDTLEGGDGNDALNGGADGDALYGGAGDDKLDGGPGGDAMSGGAGNDTYVFDDSLDSAEETDGFGNDAGGVDLVNSAVSYTLYNFIENLTLTGTGNTNGGGNGLANKITGNAGHNLLTGNGGNDLLSGGAGNDRLEGGAGLDALTGGIGVDTFVLGPAALGDADRFADFLSGTDRIGFSPGQYGLAVGSGITADGKLDAAYFVSGAGATATSVGHGQFVFNTTSKQLLWDADGAGGAAAILVATLNASVSVSDFVIV